MSARWRKHQKRFKSAKMVFRRALSREDRELAKVVTTCEYRVRWGPTLAAWICIVLGFIFAVVVRNPATGDYVLEIGKLSFKGAFGGVLVLSGAIILWLSRPSVQLIFEPQPGTEVTTVLEAGDSESSQ